MSCHINQGSLSNYVRFDKNLSWQGEIMVLNTTLDGKVIKLSEELAKEISASQYCNKAFCTQIKKENSTINVRLWMKYGRVVSKICFEEQRTQEHTCWANGETVGEVVVITSFD